MSAAGEEETVGPRGVCCDVRWHSSTCAPMTFDLGSDRHYSINFWLCFLREPGAIGYTQIIMTGNVLMTLKAKILG